MRRSLIYAAVDRYAVIAINLLITAVVARLLLPAEIGVFVIGSALLVIVDGIRDFGTSVYLIQSETVTRQGVRTAFTVTLASSAAIAALLVLSAGPLAAFYGEPGIGTVLRFAAIGLLVSPLYGPILGLMRRDMQFGAIAVIDILGAAANLVVVWLLAARDFGYLSLAWGALAAVVATAFATLALKPWFWIFRPTLTDWRDVARFGSLSTATTLLNTAYQYLPQIALGRILNVGAVGLFSRAAIFCQLTDRAVISALQPVILPMLAARARAGEDLKAAYLHGVTLVTAVQWPFLVWLVLMAEPVVHVVLGDGWTAAVPLVRLLGIAYVFLAPAFMTFPLLVAVGRIKDTLTASLIVVPLSTAILIGAAHIGLTAMAASMIAVAPLQMFIAFLFIRRQVPFRWGELGRAVWKSAAVSSLTGLGCAALLVVAALRPGLPPFALLVGAGVVGAAGWLAGLMLTRHPLLDELSIIVRGLSRWRTLHAQPAGSGPAT